MARKSNQPDPDDLFSDTRMSFGDHIEELRVHLWRAVIGFVIAMLVSLAFARPILIWIQTPVIAQLDAFRESRNQDIKERLKNGTDPELAKKNVPIAVTIELSRTQLAKLLNLPAPAPDPNGEGEEQFVKLQARIPMVDLALALNDAAPRILNPASGLVAKDLMTGMAVWFKVAIICGFILGSPWIFYQLWLFVAAGLYPHEKRVVNYYLPFCIGLFLIGVAACQFFVLPNAVRVLLEFNEWVGGEPMLGMAEWLNFALILPVMFGLSFQTPMVMLVLAKIGIMDINGYRSKRRIAWFLMAVLSAVITPTPDVFTFSLMWLPMCFLYELGIILTKYYAQPAGSDEHDESDQLVGV